jgi:hypothetical protein
MAAALVGDGARVYRGQASWQRIAYGLWRYLIMNDSNLHEQIARLEERIEQLAETIERCRKLMLFSKAAISIGGLLIVAMMFGGIRFDPAAMIGALTAVIGGTVLLGSNSSTSQQTMAAMKAAEEQRAELIDRIDLQVVGEGDRGSLLPRSDKVVRD